MKTPIWLLPFAMHKVSFTRLKKDCMHWESGMDQKTYAAKVGKGRTTIQDRWYAAEVLEAVPHMRHEARDHWRAISSLNSAPRWLWRALVSRLVSEGWTVELARRRAAPAIPASAQGHELRAVLAGASGRKTRRAIASIHES